MLNLFFKLKAYFHVKSTIFTEKTISVDIHKELDKEIAILYAENNIWNKKLNKLRKKIILYTKNYKYIFKETEKKMILALYPDIEVEIKQIIKTETNISSENAKNLTENEKIKKDLFLFLKQEAKDLIQNEKNIIEYEIEIIQNELFRLRKIYRELVERTNIFVKAIELKENIMLEEEILYLDECTEEANKLLEQISVLSELELKNKKQLKKFT